MSKQRTAWIDLTDLSGWSGFMTGTQRVTYEVAKAYYEKAGPQETHYFVYDEHSKAFYEINFRPILEEVVRSTSRVPAEQGASSNTPRRRHMPSIKGVAKAQSLRVYHNMPFRLKNTLTPQRKAQLKRAYHKLEALRASRRRNHIIRNAAKHGSPITFSEQDTVIILGKPWDTMTFIDVLGAQKLHTNFKVAHLIYDMIPSFLPHTFGYPLPKNYTNYMFDALAITDHVLAISESTKHDVIRFCEAERLPTPPISVIKLAENLLPAPAENRLPVANLKPGSFILCVGTIEIRKNHILLYTAYREGVRRKLALPKLVIVGGKGWYTQDVLHELRNDPTLKDLVTIMHKTNDEDLGWLYRNCRFTIYPSVYEGWGLPIAESLAYGKVCIASDSSSMTEVAGSMIDYFSPYDSVGCLEAIMEYMDDAKLKQKEKLIQKTYQSVTWSECATRVHSIVESIG